MTKAEQREKREWYRGFIAALAPLAQFEEDTIYDEVVCTVNEEELIQQARKDGAMKWSGLTEYRKRAPR